MIADETLHLSFIGKMKVSSSKWIMNVALQRSVGKNCGILTSFMPFCSQLYQKHLANLCKLQYMNSSFPWFLGRTDRNWKYERSERSTCSIAFLCSFMFLHGLTIVWIMAVCLCPHAWLMLVSLSPLAPTLLDSALASCPVRPMVIMVVMSFHYW